MITKSFHLYILCLNSVYSQLVGTKGRQHFHPLVKLWPASSLKKYEPMILYMLKEDTKQLRFEKVTAFKK